jgi:hypothetical protein
MKGYNRIKAPSGYLSEPVFIKQRVFVGCKNCHYLWFEERSVLEGSPAINGPIMAYDACDKCIDTLNKDSFYEG